MYSYVLFWIVVTNVISVLWVIVAVERDRPEYRIWGVSDFRLHLAQLSFLPFAHNDTATFAKLSGKFLAQTPSRLKMSGVAWVILAGCSFSALFQTKILIFEVWSGFLARAACEF